MPAIKKIHDSYSTDKLKVISVSIDSDSVAFAKAMVKNKMDWTNIFDWKREIFKAYGGDGVPAVFLIDKEGIIVYSDYEEPFEVLSDLLSTSVK